MLLYEIVLTALFNVVCLYNAYLFFAIDFCKCFLFSYFAFGLLIIIIIMVIFKCYFSGELIALS